MVATTVERPDLVGRGRRRYRRSGSSRRPACRAPGDRAGPRRPRAHAASTVTARKPCSAVRSWSTLHAGGLRARADAAVHPGRDLVDRPAHGVESSSLVREGPRRVGRRGDVQAGVHEVAPAVEQAATARPGRRGRTRPRTRSSSSQSLRAVEVGHRSRCPWRPGGPAARPSPAIACSIRWWSGIGPGGAERRLEGVEDELHAPRSSSRGPRPASRPRSPGRSWR